MSCRSSPTRRAFAWLALPATLVWLGACSDAPRRGTIGDNCADDDECVSGMCGGGICVDPSGDDDGDGLSNTIEVTIGTNPRSTDTDFDGRPDGDEVDDSNGLLDLDGDGKPDILESATDDDDNDCIPNQFDSDDANATNDLGGLVPIVCRTVGACADVGKLVVTCTDGFSSATCDYAAVEGYEAEETACDGVDNDCDGVTDDGAADSDKDGRADCVDGDIDGDDADNENDNCPTVRNAEQGDADGDGNGDACDPPRAPVLTGIAPGAFGRDAAITLTGLREVGARVRVHGDVDCTSEALAVVEPSATATFSAQVAAIDGVNRFALIAENAAGLTSDCTPSGLTYTRDTTAPDAPGTITTTPADTGFSDSPLASGTAEAGASICFYTDDSCTNMLACAPVPESGEFSTRVPLPGVGSYGVTATVVDAAGNASACAPAFTYEVLPAARPRPAAPSHHPVAAFEEETPSNTTTTPTLRVCGPADAPVRVYRSAGCMGSAVELDATASDSACPNGIVHTGEVSASANAGTDFWALTATDDGWSSTCVFVGRFEHDDRAPNPVGNAILTPASPSPDRSPLIRASGTEPLAVVTLHTASDCAGNPLATLVADGSGTISGAIEMPANTSTIVRAVASDRVGNRSACTQLAAYRHDDIAPARPTLAITWSNPTNNATLPLNGCAEAGSTVRFYSDDSCTNLVATVTASTTQGSCGPGEAPYTTNVTLQNDGPVTIRGRVMDRAGNDQFCWVLGTTLLDRVAPPVPTLAQEEVVGFTATNVSFRLYGRAEPGANVRLVSVTPRGTLPANAPCTGTNPIDVVADNDGDFEAIYTVSRTAAASVSAWARDAATNGSACATERALVGPATIIAGDDATPLEAPGLLFHDPDGGLIDWVWDPDTLFPSLTALVFRGCFGSAAWMPELQGFQDRRSLNVLELKPYDVREFQLPDGFRCRNCGFNYYGDAAIATVSVSNAPAGSSIRLYADYYLTDATPGESAEVWLYPDSHNRHECVSGTAENCQQWNHGVELYAIVVDANGYVLGYATAGFVTFAAGANFPVTMNFRADHKRFQVDIANPYSTTQRGFVNNFMFSATAVHDDTHRDYSDPYNSTPQFEIPPNSTESIDLIHYPAFGTDWGAQLGQYTNTRIDLGQLFAVSFMVMGDRGSPPNVLNRSLSEMLPFVEFLALDEGDETRRPSVTYGVPPEGITGGDMLITRFEHDVYTWTENGEQRELRTWLFLQAPAPMRKVPALTLPELLSAWDVVGVSTPDNWYNQSDPPVTALIDFSGAQGFDAIIDALGLPYLFRLFADEVNNFEVFKPLARPFMVRASQLYLGTDGEGVEDGGGGEATAQ
jgi:hypothetical protein